MHKFLFKIKSLKYMFRSSIIYTNKPKIQQDLKYFKIFITVTKKCKTINNNCSQIIQLLVIIAVNEQDHGFYGTNC